MPTTITVQVFAHYTVGDDGGVTAEVDLGDADLEFAVSQEDYGDAEWAAVEALAERIPAAGGRVTVTLDGSA